MVVVEKPAIRQQITARVNYEMMKKRRCHGPYQSSLPRSILTSSSDHLLTIVAKWRKNFDSFPPIAKLTLILVLTFIPSCNCVNESNVVDSEFCISDPSFVKEDIIGDQVDMLVLPDGGFHNYKFSYPLVGTIDGYDVGGNQSVCWESTFQDERLLSPNSKIPEQFKLLTMNKLLVDENNDNIIGNNRTETTTNLYQFLSCKGGINFTAAESQGDGTNTALNITNTGGDSSSNQVSYYAGQNISVSISLETNLARYGDSVARLETIQAWFRLLKCSTLRIGYCQPFLDSSTWVVYDISEINKTSTELTTYFKDESFENITDENTPSVFYVSDVAVPAEFTNQTSNWQLFTTRWVPRKLVKDPDHECLWKTSLTLQTKIPSTIDSGGYHLVAHATLLLYSVNASEAIRVDLAESVGVYGVEDEPYIAELNDSVVIYTGVAIGICGLFVLGMFVTVMVFKDHLVMTMAQSGLLSWLCATGFFEVLFTMFYLPTSDIFCRLNRLVLIPATMTPAIIVGRLWRVYTTLTVANRIGRLEQSNELSENQKRMQSVSQKTEQWIMEFLGMLAFSRILKKSRSRSTNGSDKRRGTSFRRKVAARTAVRLILILSLPQIIIQIFAASFYESYVTFVEQGADQTVLVQTCYNQNSRWATYFGAILMFGMYALACYTAWCSRNLPSAFNEKDQVFRATIFASFLALLLAIFSGILQVTGTNPNFTASLLVTFSLALSLVTVSSVVLPKIIRIASGEKVVVTKVLRDVNGLKAEHRTDGRTNIDVVQESGDSSTVVVIKAGQPVPEKFENDLRRLREVLSSLEDISNQARPLNQAHWFALKKATALVSHDIDHYQFEWDDRGEWRESP